MPVSGSRPLSHTVLSLIAFINTCLDYCCSLLSGISNKSLSYVQLIHQSGPYFLRLAFSIDFKMLLNTYKALRGLVPSYLTDLLFLCVPFLSLRSLDESFLIIPGSRLIHKDNRAFGVRTTKPWNNHLRRSGLQIMFPLFKSLLKTHRDFCFVFRLFCLLTLILWLLV